jgi:DNA-binding transcriptional regulator YbjK
MSLSDKINLLVSTYVRRQSPTLNPDFLGNYLQEELKELETSIRSLADASVQVTDRAPESPRKGMVRYAVSPWNPLSNSYSGLVVYNGSAWVAV